MHGARTDLGTTNHMLARKFQGKRELKKGSELGRCLSIEMCDITRTHILYLYARTIFEIT